MHIAEKKQKELYESALVVLKEYKPDPMIQIFHYAQSINVILKS